MKKKQRCFLKRFAALVAALMLCASLCVPAFASNNASTKKWYVSDERTLVSESGASTRYLLLSPYVGGSLYATTFLTQGQSFKNTTSDGTYDMWMRPVNYPDWWRSSIPLGAYSYLRISSVRVVDYYDTDGITAPSTVYFYPQNSRYGFYITGSYSSSALSLQSTLDCYPLWISRSEGSASSTLQIVGFGVSTSGDTGTAYYRLQQCSQVVYSSVFSGDNSALSYSPGFSLQYTHYNTSSDDLVICVAPPRATSYYHLRSAYAYRMTVSAVVEFWVDANKLPAGLQVGDEFPADTDAFDQLRDDLIEQFPEASENIENSKSTLTGWNDTETVDTDVASTAMSALNGLFQNLGQFLFIVSLMVFGAVVLRMFIKKAVDG